MNIHTTAYYNSRIHFFHYIIWLSLIILSTPQAYSYQMTARELPTQQLLPVSPIHRIIQDSEGFFWYATEGGGLCRDDGYSIEVFRTPFPQLSPRFNIIGVDSMSSNHISCVHEGKGKHHIWFGTYTGLHYIDKSDYSVHTPQHPLLKNKRIHHLCSTSDGSIWVNVPEWIIRLDPDGKFINKIPTNYNGTPLNITGIYEDSRHTIYISCAENLILRYDDRKGFVNTGWTFRANPTRISEDRRHRSFYVGTWGGGIAYFDPATKSTSQCIYDTKPGEFSRQILDVLFDNKRMILWVVTMDDIYAYQADRETLRAIPLDDILPSDHKVLDRIFQDSDDNILVPGYTPHTFIISMDKDNTVRYPVEASRRKTGFPVMADVVVNDDDYFWIWLGRDNLSLYHPATDRLEYGHNNGLEFIAKCIEKCLDNTGIWAATGNKILRLSHNDMIIKSQQIAEIPDDMISSLRETGNSLWIGSDKAIYEMPVSGGSPRKVCDGIGWSHKLAVDSHDNVYAATATGLVHVNPEGKTEWLIRDEDCSDVTIAPDGKLWIASLAGNVYSYDPGTRKLTNQNESCLSGGELIKGIESDESGHIWILTDQYVKEYNPIHQGIRIFYSTDKNIGMDYMHSVRKMSGNSVCIGGMGAFCVIPSSHELDNLPASPTVPIVTSITSGNRHILPGTGSGVVELNPGEGECKVTFSTLDHLHTSQVSYAYRIEGLQDEWTYLPQGSNTAHLNRLSKGSYKIMVKATNRFGIWSEPSLAITLRQLPAWYETWWAYILYFVLAVSTVFVSLWLYRRMRQIMELHRRRNEVSLSSINIDINEKSMPEFDKAFLEKAVALVERNIEDSEYNVERLSSDICMSRMSLYRKLHDQTGQTPSEFIRGIRLKRAASLLSTSEITVKEVALRVGFTTPSYFSKCFREMFGMLPAQYQKTHESTPVEAGS